ncbi:MAG: SET domain-containing protein-lysine N-methyltransferase [Azospirillaceae bacterium]|nr:SET domain-containing protein-lysine N-methyltransferase [Azospirillaceae bacterium]
MSPDQLVPTPLEAEHHYRIFKPFRAGIGSAEFPGKGRGVVALVDLPADTLLERCPVLIIPDRDRQAVDPTIVFTYVFMWEHGTTEQDLYQHRGRAAIALGLTSLLNHSYTPNARFVRHIDERILEIWSETAIRAGDEITIDYQMDLWFDPD